MSWFRRNGLIDDVAEIDWYRQSGSYWLQRGRNLVFSKAMAAVLIIVAAVFVLRAMNDMEMRIWTKVKVGDKLYVDSISLIDTGLTYMSTFRRIRPANAADIQKQNIPEWKKQKLIATLDTTLEHNRPTMLSSNVALVQNNFFKNHSAFVGTLIKRDSLCDRYYKTHEPYSPEKWYAVNVNYKVCDTNFNMKMPQNYVFADNYLYVSATLVEQKEATVFLKNNNAANLSKTDTVAGKQVSKKPLQSKSKLRHKKKKQVA